MRKVALSILVFVACWTVAAAQITRQVQEVVTLSEERTFYLNGGLRSVAGGHAKVVVPIDLPENTVSWLYSFSTAAGSSGIKNLNLALQVGSILLDPTVTMAKIISAVKVPAGSSAINVYLLDEKNRKGFEDSWEVYGTNYTYIQDGSTLTTKQGVVKVTDQTQGRWYLGIHNPSSLEAVNVTIEVSAIVKAEQYVDEWRPDKLVLLKDGCVRGFRSGLPGADIVCDCAVQQLAAQLTPSQWASKGTDQIAYGNALIEDCYAKTGQTALQAAEDVAKRGQKDIDAGIRAASSAALLADFAGAGRQMNEAIARIEAGELQTFYGDVQMAQLYNTAALYALLNNQPAAADVHLRKALAHNSQDMHVWKIIGLYHLVVGDADKARPVLLRYKPKDRLPNGRKWADDIAEFLHALEQNGITSPLFDEAREWLKIKR
jgi:hypothetical protein